MKRFAAFFAAVTLVMSTGVASADTNAISFEPPDYAPGSIQGQDGWQGSGVFPINPAIDQAIVTNGGSAPASFGAQSWRFSNAYTDGAFALWPFSPSLNEEAGEFEAEGGGFSTGPRQTHFEVAWSFASASPTLSYQPSLQMSTAPDRGDGARMSFIRLTDQVAGLRVDFVDFVRGAVEPAGTCVVGNFVEHTVASGLSRAVPHTVRLAMDFVDGPANDVVKVYVDGSLRYTGTSWEDYFRDCEGNPPRTVDSMIFQARSGGGTAPGTLGQGFLLDNLSYASSQPTTCNVIQGTAVGETIIGTNKADCIDGAGGDDTIYGLQGRDVLLGSGGNDTIYGGNGADYVSGGDGDDTLYGNNGPDDLSGDADFDIVDGGRGRDSCLGEVLISCEL